MRRDAKPSTTGYAPSDLSRADVDALEGPAVVDFGTSWCGICRATAPTITAAFAAHPAVMHIRIEDGPGRPLGRWFGVKLWPTLIFLRDGAEVERLIRPRDVATIRQALRRIDPS
jgi:thioredoxin 1